MLFYFIQFVVCFQIALVIKTLLKNTMSIMFFIMSKSQNIPSSIEIFGIIVYISKAETEIEENLLEHDCDSKHALKRFCVKNYIS